MIEKATVFCEDLDHPECIAVHSDGSIWAGGEAGQIYRISADGSSTEVVASTGGFILGIAFSPDMSWLAICDLAKKCVWKLTMDDLKLSEFSTGAEGHTFNIPNYAVFDEEGNLTGGEFKMDMASIQCADLEGEKKGKLEGHLSSDDFFGVDAVSFLYLTLCRCSR